MARGGYHCQRCKDMKKGCEGGRPCGRCTTGGFDCVPYTPSNRRPPTANTSAAPNQAPTQSVAPTQQGSLQQDQVAAETTLPAGFLHTLPRPTSLRTKATGPDMWPDVKWSYVGNQQFCRTDGLDRVMAMKERASKRRRLNSTATSPSNAQDAPSAEMPHDSNERGMGSSLHFSYGKPAPSFLGHTAGAPSTFSSQQPGIPSHRNAAINPITMNGIARTQQLPEAFHDRVGSTVSTNVRESGGQMPGRAQDSTSMPPPPPPATYSAYGGMTNEYRGQRMDASSSLDQDGRRRDGNTLMQPFGRARATFATDAEHDEISKVQGRQREDTPPFPG
ncbi:hypothetical protein PRZ48_007414 [Zasmidium cellare]|uniref:Zn(2)-C6 fungal-type domain-containing protein n=1 Tax=Zasmidium cellare TaxID=395010 RepID=A0ABR0EJD2_ZASCE|nr:hypothetical protein PRZ48_007414 [Zasmidium cellare]